ncbi:hypothetical protein PVAND_011544 [Polypedilum vanderplanki]|uniref:NOC3-like protein n=1 Tax=Polypedilum vanderplanki TaxID=319348 RepID=A0A9J6CJT1_POLVA|nr:hypothetical protein PVAND_011544 [Polypedilum vanderplanki]
MPIRKNIKISATKRGHHERNKKNFLKTKKQLHREKQIKENIFKKSKNEQKKVFSNGKNKLKKGKSINHLEEERNRVINLSDIKDMIMNESSDEENENRPTNGYHNVIKRQKLDPEISSSSEIEFEDESESENEEITEQMEIEQKKNFVDEAKQKGKIKELLPIKTKSGVLPRAITHHDDSVKDAIYEDVVDDDSDDGDKEPIAQKIVTTEQLKKKNNIVSASELLSEREEEFKSKKFRIGKMCSSITEKPEEKVGSLRILIEFMQEYGSDKQKNLISIRKLAMLSLTEVFKDIVPEYKVGIIDLENQKVKKDTLARITYENELLRYYKKFLKESESMLKALKPGKFAKRPSKEEIYLGEAAILCLCELLKFHPYFNFSTNIAQLLVIYLNCFNSYARKTINETFIKIFKTDKRLDIVLHIVRHINHLVKKKSNSVFVEVISCLLSLPIKNINVDAEKEAELKQKKLEQHKSRLISMSKRERKRKKKLSELEKELMETQAEENKQSKHSKLTDISKLVFSIYFRILKENPKTRILSCTLEGLAKFAHIINIEFFSDLIEVLNNLIENADLGYREQIHCIQTVFAILSGQGEALNIDPARFYTHLYRNILHVNAGKNHEDVESVVTIMENVLIKRRKNITQLRYLAFMKRLMTLTIHLQQNGALGCLSIIKNAMQLNSSLDILLDTECKVGSGKFDPSIIEPEFSNANCTSFFELALLKRHYHSVVVKMADHISSGCQIGNNILDPSLSKMAPIDFIEKYDSSQMAFNPPIPIPSKECTIKIKSNKHIFKLKDVQGMCLSKNNVIKKTDDHLRLNFDFAQSMNILNE